ncbi:MAG: hypothetical protein ACK5LX_07740 [Oscillospiraceae bacterium]
MEKTKLGLSVGLMAALLYFSGLLNVLVVFLIGGYILLREDNAWLRRAAVKGMLVVALFAVATSLVGILGDLFSIISSFLNGLPGDRYFNLRFPLGLDSILRYAIAIIRCILLTILGVSALNKKDFTAGPVDGMIDKHFGTEGKDVNQVNPFVQTAQPQNTPAQNVPAQNAPVQTAPGQPPVAHPVPPQAPPPQQQRLVAPPPPQAVPQQPQAAQPGQTYQQPQPGQPVPPPTQAPNPWPTPGQGGENQ